MSEKVEISDKDKLILSSDPILLQRHIALVECFNSLVEFIPDLGGIIMMKKFCVLDAMDEVNRSFDQKQVTGEV